MLMCVVLYGIAVVSYCVCIGMRCSVLYGVALSCNAKSCTVLHSRANNSSVLQSSAM